MNQAVRSGGWIGSSILSNSSSGSQATSRQIVPQRRHTCMAHCPVECIFDGGAITTISNALHGTPNKHVEIDCLLKEVSLFFSDLTSCNNNKKNILLFYFCLSVLCVLSTKKHKQKRQNAHPVKYCMMHNSHCKSFTDLQKRAGQSKKTTYLPVFFSF